MQNFDDIRFYNAEEVNEAVLEYVDHPMFRALLQFTFPQKSPENIHNLLKDCFSIEDFQSKVIYHSVARVLEKSTEGFSTSGFDQLAPQKPYLYLSNHRDIILDTSLINFALMNHEQLMTASAIGDNLVKKTFLLVLSRLTRNFLVRRSLTPREMLASSKRLSEYIHHLLNKPQSVWMAHREGRTKDGNDRTQQGVLKMLAMNRGKESAIAYLRRLNIVPAIISYEFDPTDILKVPELVAKSEDIVYVKSSNEDFNSMMRGALGYKKRVHIALGTLGEEVYERIEAEPISDNDKLQKLAQEIDRCMHRNYKLWPSNLVAYDLYHNSTKYAHIYTDKDKRAFERRLERRISADSTVARESFLLMYANPVLNKEALHE